MVEQDSRLLTRSATDADLPSILALLQASLGWVPDAAYEQFFTWKHRENPAGPSPGWVAVDPSSEGRIVGFRTFMRWEFEWRGRRLRAVRAVDTATHPEYQGRGIFSRLTLAALEDLRAEGVDFVFNTPNEQSRPGYLKMGWQVVGRPPTGLTLRAPASLLRVARARTPADKWSLPAAIGIAGSEAFEDREAVQQLVQVTKPSHGIHTRRTPEYLAWRYGFDPLAYRVLQAGAELHDGVVVLRFRRRGPATEAAICDVLVPPDDKGSARRLVRRALAESGADYALQVGAGRGAVRLPRQGPLLVCRPLDDWGVPPPHDWSLTLGDVELF